MMSENAAGPESAASAHPGMRRTNGHRYDRLLAFAGALIVFLTFVVKEGKRDELKDLTAAIDSAESIFVIRTQMGASNEKLRLLIQSIKDVQQLQLRIQEMQFSMQTGGKFPPHSDYPYAALLK